MKTIYQKIQLPLAILFAIIAVAICIDYFLSPYPTPSRVIDFSTERTGASKGGTSQTTHYIEATTGSYTIEDAGYDGLFSGDKILHYRSAIFHATRYFSPVENPEKHFHTLTGPFRLFPMIPILFLLPLVFRFFPEESMLAIAGRNGSMILAAGLTTLLFIG